MLYTLFYLQCILITWMDLWYKRKFLFTHLNIRHSTCTYNENRLILLKHTLRAVSLKMTTNSCLLYFHLELIFARLKNIRTPIYFFQSDPMAEGPRLCIWVVNRPVKIILHQFTLPSYCFNILSCHLTSSTSLYSNWFTFFFLTYRQKIFFLYYSMSICVIMVWYYFQQPNLSIIYNLIIVL